MKRRSYGTGILTLLISVVILSVFYLHVHAYKMNDPVDVYCPNCGRQMVIEWVSQDATCEDDGIGTAMCPHCGAVENYRISLPAYGHEYKLIKDEEATCTKAGEKEYLCERCGDSYIETIPATGHSYKKTVKKEVTCTEDGLIEYKCSKCGKTYSETIKAKGHDIEYEEKEATCTEDGYKKGICKNCKEEFNEVIKAKGHKLGSFTISKKATCTEDGIKKATCSVCGETVEEKIEKLGHKYPEEWTIEKKSGYFTEGLESKACENCGEKIEQIIPKKDPTILFIIGAAVLAVIGGALAFLRSSRYIKRRAEKPAEDPDKFKPSFEDKTVLVASTDKELIEILKTKDFLEVDTCEYEQIKEKAEENKPDILIVDVLSEEALSELEEMREDTLKDTGLGLIVSEEMIDEHKDKLDELVKDKKIINYISFGSDACVILVKMILPILKPDLKSDESLENIGAIADALGIPGISTVINVYTSGRDIKSTIEEGELSISSTATVISDIASILGLDTVGSVAGLVDDIDSIKNAVSSEAGAKEVKDGVAGAKDIVDVVSDIIDK